MFDPHDFLELAKWLLKERCNWDQARLRTVVSRSYYSAFLRSLQYVLRVNPLAVDLESHKIHQQVVQALKKDHWSISNKLYSLKDARVEADYKFAEISLDETKKAVRLAEDIHQKLDLA